MTQTEFASRRLTLACLWVIFLVRGMFYISFVPLWEGFDEWSHYAVLQNMATGRRLLIGMNDPVSREVQASLELAPMARQFTGLKHDGYWRLPEAERKDRERRLRSLPAEWTREPAEKGAHAYEAQQAPLYYWLLAPAYRPLTRLPLPARVWLLRLLSLLAASIVIPMGFLVARRVFGDDCQALAIAALIAAFPELMMTVCHIGNDSLAVAMGALFLFVLFEWKAQPHSMRLALALGGVLGLALLTKAYFLALLPPLVALGAMEARRKQVYGPVVAIFGGAIVIPAWWYVRNWALTHSISGEQLDAAVQNAPRVDLHGAARQVNWLQAADFTFLTHIWLGNWSFLVVRSWMYHVLAAAAGLACIGLIVRLFRRPNGNLALLSGIYLSFLLGLGYHAVLAFQMEGFPGALGYYLFAIVIAEAILAVAGLEAIAPAAWARAIVPAGIVCFVALEAFGMSFYSIPYYTGFIAHLPNGGLPALGIAQLQNGGWYTMLDRLTANKPAFLSAPVMATLWMLFLAATFGLIATSVRLASRRKRI
jgi:4-amino-4-deoxy-L-arabinose transferase-like glycosyltransferase